MLPESRGGSTTADDVVTVNFAYFRNKKGGIGRYVWVNDVELEYLEDYQARMLTRCSKCGEVMEGDTCEYCGSKKYERKAEDTFALFEDIERSDGSIIPAYTTEYQLPMEGMQEIIIDPFTGEAMEAIPEEVSVQTKIPYYKPDCYPIVLRRNVSSWGKVLGDSDVSKIQDQQNAIKKCDTRVQEKLHYSCLPTIQCCCGKSYPLLDSFEPHHPERRSERVCLTSSSVSQDESSVWARSSTEGS